MPSAFEQSPVINSPFRKPERHFALNDDGSPYRRDQGGPAVKRILRANSASQKEGKSHAGGTRA